jgi:putative Holliday junction resolvase
MGSSYTALAFDFGSKNIGVAVGNSELQSHSPLDVIPARDGIPNWDSIESIIVEWEAQHLVVGLPLNMDGSVSEMSRRARKFGNRLHARFKRPIHFIDERLSTREAKELAHELGHQGAYAKSPVDALAACVLLKNWWTNQDTI